jgi:ABC-type polysaccharide/polyol phosphate transport system ATPase subunit
LKNDGKTIVLVTHSMNAVNEFCDRAIWLYDGKIKIDGPSKEVTKEYLKICG